MQRVNKMIWDISVVALWITTKMSPWAFRAAGSTSNTAHIEQAHHKPRVQSIQFPTHYRALFNCTVTMRSSSMIFEKKIDIKSILAVMTRNGYRGSCRTLPELHPKHMPKTTAWHYCWLVCFGMYWWCMYCDRSVYLHHQLTEDSIDQHNMNISTVHSGFSQSSVWVTID